MLKDKWQRFKKGLKDGGIDYLLYSLTSHFPEWLLRYYHVVFIRGEDIKLFTRPHKDYDIRFADESDAGNFEEVESTREKALHRLRRGDSCVIVLKDDRVVSISWAATGRLYNRYAGCIVDTGDDGFFLYGVYSVPEERLKGFFTSCFKKQFEYYAGQGRTVKYGVIEVLNKSSIKAHLRIGFKTVGETYYLAILGISICYYKTWPVKTRKFHIFFKRPPQNLEWV